MSVFKLEQESLVQDLLYNHAEEGDLSWTLHMTRVLTLAIYLHGKSSCFSRCYLEKGQDLDPAGVKMQNTIIYVNAVFSRA